MFTEHRITAQDGLSLYVRDYPRAGAAGAHVPILCLGGITRNSKDFHDLAERLSRTRRVIAPDYRGRGQSGYDPDPDNYRPETYLNDIHHILAALNVHRVVLIGTSLGGLLTAAFSVIKPAALVGALLNDVGPIIGGPAFSDIVDYMGADRVHDNTDAAITYLKTQFPDLPAHDKAAWATLVENVMCRGEDGRLRPDWDPNIAAPLQRKKGPMMPELWPLFRALGGRPILALRGGRSKLLSRETFSDIDRKSVV